MAQYEEAASSVLSTITSSGLTAATKDAITAIIGSTGNVTLAAYDGTTAPKDTKVVTVGADQELTTDPGGQIIIMDADAPGANATFDASTDRAVVASSNDDNLTFTGNGSVTVETGGGNDSITTGDGNDVIIANGKGDVTVKTGGGNDEVIVQGTGTRTIDLSDGGGTNTVVIQSSDVEVYVTGGEGTDLVFLDEDRNVHKFSIDSETGRVIFHSDNPTTLKDVEFVKFAEDQLTVIADSQDKSVVAKLYQVAFDRDADLEGMTFWMDFLDKGNSLEHTVYSFINSTEFRDHHQTQTNEQYVSSLYKGFDREADSAGVSYWVNELNTGGATREDVAWAFAESSEATQVMGIDGNQYVIDIF